MTASPLKKRWKIAPPLSQEAARGLADYSPILQQILFHRGYRTPEAAQAYLAAQPPADTSPWLLSGMEAAVDRLLWAIRKRQSIVVYGDYDADGVTATALLKLVLQAFGADVQGYIPNRFEEGYGLNREALNYLRQQGTDLVITVDCGARSPSEVAEAEKQGLDLIITDHHQPGAEIPPAIAVINPHLPGDPYPDKNLAGVGLAYKLACALIERAPEAGLLIPFWLEPQDFLDLVALGTITDLAPLIGENRALVRLGLQRLRSPIRQGIMSLIGVSNLTPSSLTSWSVSFQLGPRLNAAGRLDTAYSALHLLTTTDLEEAGRLAQELHNQNKERQKIMLEIQQQAEAIIQEEDPEALLLFAGHADFNEGVIGLAASRLTEQYYRPAIVAKIGEQETRASCRSIPEFHITQALDECADLLIRHGGHAAAAGFTVRTHDLGELVARLKEIARRQLADQDLRPTLVADAEVKLSDLHPSLLKDLEWLEPTGFGNPRSRFVSRQVRVSHYRLVGQNQEHLKLTLTDGRITFDAIAFRQGYWASAMPPYIDVLFTFETNEYNGQKTLQLNVQDLRPAGAVD